MAATNQHTANPPFCNIFEENQAPASSTYPALLPAVPSTTIERIRPAEFVNFDSLLPQNIGQMQSGFSLKFNESGPDIGMPGILVQERKQPLRSKVFDLAS